MHKKQFNDLIAILEGLPDKDVQRIPRKYREFAESSMIPGEKSDVDPTIPIEEQQLSEETRSLLASLSLTYWAESPEERRELAEKLHRNELKYQGKPEAPMTDEEYLDFLSYFDDWNEFFGPIPFWAESKNTKPKVGPMYVQNPELQDRISQIAQRAEEMSDGRIKFEEFVALPCFGQIVLRFDLDCIEVSLKELDEYESMLNELVGDEFLTDFMGMVYRKAGVDYSRLGERLTELAAEYADEPITASVHGKGIAEDAARLLQLADLSADEKVWEIQLENGEWSLLVMERPNRKLKDVIYPVRINLFEVSEDKCTGLVKAAFHAKRNHISLGRLINGAR